YCWIAKLASVQIHYRDVNAMFYFTFAKFMQVRLPVRVFLKIFSDVLRKQDVSRITAVHDPLCDVDPRAGHVRFPGCVDDPTDRPTMYAHSQPKFRVFLERASYFQCAFSRLFGTIKKTQHDAVARRDCDQAPRRFRGPIFISTSDNVV